MLVESKVSSTHDNNMKALYESWKIKYLSHLYKKVVNKKKWKKYHQRITSIWRIKSSIIHSHISIALLSNNLKAMYITLESENKSWA